MTAPGPIEVAKLHEQEIRRLSQAMSIEQTQLKRTMVGRKCRPKGKSGPEYRITDVVFNGAGFATIHGSLWSRRRRIQIGDLNSVELV